MHSWEARARVAGHSPAPLPAAAPLAMCVQEQVAALERALAGGELDEVQRELLAADLAELQAQLGVQ